MLDTSIEWLRKHWWGLLIAYCVAIAGSYIAIWIVVEPLGIPDNFTTLSPMLNARATYHILGSILLGVHVVLLLELLVRKRHWTALAGQPIPSFDRGYGVQHSKAFYDTIASRYDQRNSPSLLRTHEQVITSIKKATIGRKASKILDLGGGTGKLVAHHFFDCDHFHWTYVDESPQMVEQFKNNLAGTKLTKTVRIEEISEYLRCVSVDQFDVIVLSFVLTSMERNPDWKAIALRLAHDGRVIIAEIDAAYTATNPYYVVKTAGQRHALHPRLVPLTDVLHGAQAAGLELVKSHPITQAELPYAFVAELIRKT